MSPGPVRALHMEWTKLRTVRSTPWLIVAIAGFSAAVSALAAWAVAANPCPSPSGCAGEDTARLTLSGVYLGQIAVVLLAVLAVSSEYGTDTIRVTLAAYPRRLVVFAAKVAVVLAVVLVAGVLGVAGSLVAGWIFLPGRRFVGANTVAPLSLADEPTLRAAIGTVLYLGLVAVLSLGVATVVRHASAALSMVLAMLLLPPMIVPLVTDPHWREWILKASPMTAGLAIQATRRIDALPIGPWHGLGVLAAYAGVLGLVGGVLFTIRDA